VLFVTFTIAPKAEFPSNATHVTYVTHARKYVTNATNATDVTIASSSQQNRAVLFPAKLKFLGFKKSIVQILVGFFTSCAIYDANQI